MLQYVTNREYKSGVQEPFGYVIFQFHFGFLCVLCSRFLLSRYVLATKRPGYAFVAAP